MIKRRKTIYEAWSDLGKAVYRLLYPCIDELEKVAEKVTRCLDD